MTEWFSETRADRLDRTLDNSSQPGDAEAILNRLQRNGGALSSCECGSRNWLPPDGIYQLVATSSSAAHHVPAKAIVPVTCAACGFTKFYDPAVVAARAESTGRW
jgi:predicted nucleic-acid-binding Zn-ribbon protein